MTELVGTVESTEWLSPSMIRVRLNGDGLTGFTPTGSTDEYVNARFIPDGAPYSAPFDVDAAQTLAPELRPRNRRYTVRRWDGETGVLTIDFVVHGDVGHAGRWARSATPGDTLQMVGPSGGYRPDPDADWYLLAGDESALPAIAASLEVLPRGKEAAVFVVVDGPDDRIALTSPAELDVRWLHRSTCPDPDTVLAEAMAGFEWRPGIADVFVHGEAAETRATRRHLLAERGVAKGDASISPYWRRQYDDEAWRQVKRQWMADQENDI